jgi:serine/threonine protein kinase
VTDLDIQNEAISTARLLESGGHKNIIGILGHGWIESSYQYYFIDMEFCDFNLHNYIHDPSTISVEIDDSPDIEIMDPIHLLLGTIKKEVEWSMKLLNIWTIMSETAAGLAFLHSHGQVHRDLKPRNGNLSMSPDFNLQFYTL